MNILPYLVLAIVVGFGIALQAPINAAFSRYLEGNAFVTAMLSVSFTLILLSIVVFVFSDPIPIRRVITVPWWVWGGGVMGALIVAGSILAVPKLGAAGMVTIVVTAQVLLALVLDHFGVFGLTPEPISIIRILGVMFLIFGVVLVRFM